VKKTVPFYGGQELRRVYERMRREGYAFIASNIAEPNILMGLLGGAQESRADLLLQISHGAMTFAGIGDAWAGLRALWHYIRELSAQYDIGVFLNLDHQQAKHLDLLERAIAERIPSSIMIDASHEPFEENVRITRHVVELAKPAGILVEGELGIIKGAEDEIVSDEAFYTDPDDAVEFVERTGVDLLAISIGTQHGVSKGRQLELRLDIAQRVDDALKAAGYDVPLVVHGSSGLSTEQLRQLIRCGVCKINRDTFYQYVYARTAYDFYRQHHDGIVPPEGVAFDPETFESAGGDWTPNKRAFDPRAVGKEIQRAVSDALVKFNREIGSAGKSLFI
jgi:fructose-bisphosphate aldolase class II